MRDTVYSRRGDMVSCRSMYKVIIGKIRGRCHLGELGTDGGYWVLLMGQTEVGRVIMDCIQLAAVLCQRGIQLPGSRRPLFWQLTTSYSINLDCWWQGVEALEYRHWVMFNIKGTINSFLDSSFLIYHKLNFSTQ